MRFQDTMILSKVTWNLYASWNNKSILKTKQKMALPRAPPYKNGIFKPPIQQRGIFKTRVPLYKNGIFETPYTAKWSFRDPLYNSPIQKMTFSIPPITSNYLTCQFVAPTKLLRLANKY